MKTTVLQILVLTSIASCASVAQADWVKKSIIQPGENILEQDSGEKILRLIPRILREDALPSKEVYRETLIPGKAPQALSTKIMFENSEVRTLVSQGPIANRINLTVVGDGYTLQEKEKFFTDANRLTKELFTGATFASYLPLFNVQAVFVASKESGLSDLEKKDTALGLYRDPPGSKRAIMPGNTEVIDAALALAQKTDYPILVANDDFYGGLGGEYAITTRSLESGIVVLRHELGHNFGEVGEEYDGGWVYIGANYSPTSVVNWKHWIEGDFHNFETLFLSGNYAWQDLNIQPYTTDFNFPAPGDKGPYQFEIQISSVGWQTPDDVSIVLDGQTQQLEGHYTADRSFFTFHLNESLAPGKHHLSIVANNTDTEHVLANAMIYAQPGDLDWSKDSIQAFATYNELGEKIGYRPTHRSCLMRDMRSTQFCAVDQENMWVRFLSRIHLIDSVEQSAHSNNLHVAVKTPQLNGLEFSWYQVSNEGVETEITELRGKTSWDVPTGISGKKRVRVQFHSPEVRSTGLAFEDSQDFEL